VTTNDFPFVAIAIRRDKNGVPYYKYYSNGKENVAGETWSSSKPFATVAAGSYLNEKCPGSGLQSVAVGNSSVPDAFNVPLGDLITIIASYDVTAGYSSNELAFYFTTICGGTRVNNLITEWLGRKNETMSGSYGAPLKKSLDLGYNYSYSNNQFCEIVSDNRDLLSNTLSPLTMAELFKHIVLYRDIPVNNRLPLRWIDILNILYGPEKSKLFPVIWGGLTSDMSIFLQSAFESIDFETIKNQSNGKWRIFSKTGAGFTFVRNRTEIIVNGYGSFPVYDSSGEIVVNKGLELIFSGKFWIYGDINIYGPILDKFVHQYVQAVVQQIKKDLPNK
jgi:hypothetical protein